MASTSAVKSSDSKSKSTKEVTGSVVMSSAESIDRRSASKSFFVLVDDTEAACKICFPCAFS